MKVAQTRADEIRLWLFILTKVPPPSQNKRRHIAPTYQHRWPQPAVQDSRFKEVSLSLRPAKGRTGVLPQHASAVCTYSPRERLCSRSYSC